MSQKRLVWSVLLLFSSGVSAEVVPAPLFQNGAVLQREKPVPVWGRADPLAVVTVEFAGQTKSATADAAGRWVVNLEPLEATAEGRTMVMTQGGRPSLEIKDVVVGEVWLGSGQSNMQWAVNQSRPEDQAAAAAGAVPMLRLFDVPRVLNHSRQETVSATWQPATPETVPSFSAVGYFFGRHLAEELKIPIGIIHSSWGGSRIEPWWAEEGLEGIGELAETRARRLARSPGFPEYEQQVKQFIPVVRGWADAAEKALGEGRPVPDVPAGPERLQLGHNAETGTYQAMIHPLVPFALRGFIWYQGESNNGEGMAYTTKKKALIAGWRKQFAAPEAPFLFVQLAPYNYGDDRKDALPGLWWAQQKTLEVPHTGMAVINDIGNVRDIHPNNKSEVGRRLALWAMADTYGRKDLVKSGPLFAAHEVTPQGIVIRFEHVGGGLVTRDGKAPDWFEVAGADGNFHPADATISADGKSIVLKSGQVAKPERARFAWGQLAEPNLMNREGLPAGAFHTHWP